MDWLKGKGYGTRDAWKGLGASVLLHIAGAVVALSAFPGMLPFRTPLVIDLTIGGPWGARDSAAPAPAMAPRGTAKAVRPEPPSPVPSPAAPAIPLPAAMPEPVPVPAKEATPVAAIPAPTDRQAGEAAPPGPGAVSGVPTFTASAVAGFPQGTSPGASAARAATRAGAGGEGYGDARATERGRYLERNYAYIRDAIQQGIAYPSMARRMGWEGKVVVSFLVLSDGSVRDVRVVLGSGHPVLDRGAVDAVRKAAPFPRPPAEAEIITPVVYRLE